MKNKILVISLPLIGLFFFYGIMVGHYQIFPFEILSYFKNIISTPNEIPPRIQIHQDLSKVSDLIKIKTIDDIENKRRLLINYIWAGSDIPLNKFPQIYQSDIHDQVFSDLYNLKRIDSFTVEMDYGMNSISYLFLANDTNNKLVIYHQGHDSISLSSFNAHSFEQDKNLIQYFLNRNYSVLIFSMVGQGMNNEPIIEFQNFGTIRMNSHNHFKLLESEKFHPIKFFIEPVIVVLNQIQKDHPFESYIMLGKDGGGWTTIIVSAIDIRIQESYSVAGSFPLWMRSSEMNYGDYEQNIPEFYSIANYEELYLMSAYGENRKLILFYNEFDPCCFAGYLYELYPFGNVIKSNLNNLGEGEFDVIIDRDQNKHIISDYTLDKIITEIKN